MSHGEWHYKENLLTLLPSEHAQVIRNNCSSSNKTDFQRIIELIARGLDEVERNIETTFNHRLTEMEGSIRHQIRETFDKGVDIEFWKQDLKNECTRQRELVKDQFNPEFAQSAVKEAIESIMGCSAESLKGVLHEEIQKSKSTLMQRLKEFGT